MDNLISRKLGVILCYSDIPDSTQQSKLVENLLIEEFQFDRKNVHTYRDLDLKNFEKLLE